MRGERDTFSRWNVVPEPERFPVASLASVVGRIMLRRNGLAPRNGGSAALGASVCHSDVITRYNRSCLGGVHEVDYALEVVD